tara:strand:+ start:375 stop:590 length:216 start_codon:yes stop_codon:yes gene_type:complete
MILKPASNAANHSRLIDALINELAEAVHEDSDRFIAELTAAQEAETALEEIQLVVEAAIRNMTFLKHKGED